MRSVLALLVLTLAAGAAGTACAADAPDRADLPPCDRPVRFVAGWFADPKMDFGRTSTELVGLGAPAGEGATALGLVTVENSITVTSEKTCRGLRAELAFQGPVLRVASELPADSCARAHVLRHEYTHVRIYREMARRFEALAYPWPEAATPELVLRHARQQLAKLQEAQRLFDSREEYAGNLTACKGEIPRLLAAAHRQ